MSECLCADCDIQRVGQVNHIHVLKARAVEAEAERNGFARSFLSMRTLLVEGALELATDRDYERWQEAVGNAIEVSKPAAEKARAVLGKEVEHDSS